MTEKPILEFLYERKQSQKGWASFYDGFENSIIQAMPPNTPKKIKVKIMSKLMKSGLVSGCVCGCRGDFEITQKGIKVLLSLKEKT